MSKPTRVLVQEKDLHTAAVAEEPVLHTQYLILNIIPQRVYVGQGVSQWLLSGLERLAHMWTC